MTLIEKLGTINLPKVAPLAEGYASTIEELWNTVIVPKLPHCDVVLKWHRTLMDYVASPNAMFAIRGCNTAPKERYDDLRRGF